MTSVRCPFNGMPREDGSYYGGNTVCNKSACEGPVRIKSILSEDAITILRKAFPDKTGLIPKDEIEICPIEYFGES